VALILILALGQEMARVTQFALYEVPVAPVFAYAMLVYAGRACGVPMRPGGQLLGIAGALAVACLAVGWFFSGSAVEAALRFPWTDLTGDVSLNQAGTTVQKGVPGLVIAPGLDLAARTLLVPCAYVSALPWVGGTLANRLFLAFSVLIPRVFRRYYADETLTPAAAPDGATKHYTCFVSYSARDQDFARRLHADLQDRGVRCCFAPQDMKIGANIRDALDEEVRRRDKMLLILSEASIASRWVENEVTKAFEEERLREDIVLLPIRIDDAVFVTDEAWAVRLRASRHIGDFSNWKDPIDYKNALYKLVRDLRSPTASNPPLPPLVAISGAGNVPAASQPLFDSLIALQRRFPEAQLTPQKLFDEELEERLNGLNDLEKMAPNVPILIALQAFVRSRVPSPAGRMEPGGEMPVDVAKALEMIFRHSAGKDGGWPLDLSGLDLRHSVNIASADLRNGLLKNADLRAVHLEGADLQGADLSGAQLERANLRGALLNDANLREASLNDANLSRVNLAGADLSGARLERVNLREAFLNDANLSGVNLAGADLSGARLERAGLQGAVLNDANLREAFLNDANLSRVNLAGADLSGARLESAYFLGASGDSKTQLPDHFPRPRHWPPYEPAPR
jgi:hypothetical protein